MKKWISMILVVALAASLLATPASASTQIGSSGGYAYHVTLSQRFSTCVVHFTYGDPAAEIHIRGYVLAENGRGYQYRVPLEQDGSSSILVTKTPGSSFRFTTAKCSCFVGTYSCATVRTF